MLLFVTAVLVVLVVSFMCSIFESVLLSISRPQIESLVQQGKRSGSLLAGFRDNMDVPIAAILILNTAAHTVGAAVAGASYSDVFNEDTLWVFSIVFTIAVLLLTEIIPKTLGVSYAASIATPVAYGIEILTRVLKPVVVVCEAISTSLRREQDVPVTSTDEIRLLATLGRSEGVVGQKTAGMIVGATHLKHLEAHDVMLPRENVRFLSAEMNREEAINAMHTSGHSRFPFTPTRDINDLTGMVLTKQLSYWLLTNVDDKIDWDAVVREPLIVPHSAPLPQLLRTFQETQRHLAIVVDEYGSVEGIATLEDVLEEVVGEIQDETDFPLEDFNEGEDGTLIVRADVDLRKLSARLGIPWDPAADVATIGGFVTESLERIPVPGDSIEWNDYRVEVLRADRRRARLLAVRKA